MMDRREPADLDCARCGQPIQRDQRWEWEKDRGTARECFGRGQRGSRGSQGLPRDDITSHLVAACSPARGLLPIRSIMSTPWAVTYLTHLATKARMTIAMTMATQIQLGGAYAARRIHFHRPAGPLQRSEISA